MKKQEREFELVNTIINRHWERAVGLANAESLMTYWAVGAFVSSRLKSAAWGAKVVEELSDYLKSRNPKLRGFSKRQIYYMIDFYEAYTSIEFTNISERLRLDEFVQTPSAQISDTTAQVKSDAIVQSLTVQSSDSLIVQTASAQLDDKGLEIADFPIFLTLTTFSNHIEILNCCSSMEERVFYVLHSARERLKYRELRRSIANRTMSPVMVAEYRRLLVPEDVMRKSLEEYCEFMKRDVVKA